MSLLKDKYKNLGPHGEYLTDLVVLSQAWKKTHNYIRRHNWYANVLELDSSTTDIERYLKHWATALLSSDFRPEPMRLVPAPKNAAWHFPNTSPLDNVNSASAQGAPFPAPPPSPPSASTEGPVGGGASSSVVPTTNPTGQPGIPFLFDLTLLDDEFPAWVPVNGEFVQGTTLGGQKLRDFRQSREQRAEAVSRPAFTFGSADRAMQIHTTR